MVLPNRNVIDMKEIFIIHDETTGYIDGGVGRINRQWDEQHKDGSTMLERIPKIVAKKEGRTVSYLPEKDLPNPNEHKVSVVDFSSSIFSAAFRSLDIIPLTEEDKAAIETAKPKSEIEKLKERVAELENLL